MFVQIAKNGYFCFDCVVRTQNFQRFFSIFIFAIYFGYIIIDGYELAAYGIYNYNVDDDDDVNAAYKILVLAKM